MSKLFLLDRNTWYHVIACKKLLKENKEICYSKNAMKHWNSNYNLTLTKKSNAAFAKLVILELSYWNITVFKRVWRYLTVSILAKDSLGLCCQIVNLEGMLKEKFFSLGRKMLPISWQVCQVERAVLGIQKMPIKNVDF